MPLTISNYTGDGVTVDLIDCDVTLPDSGSSVTVTGRVQKVGSPAADITGSPMTAPSVPASGYTGWIIQVDTTSGALSTKTAAGAIPTVDAGNLKVFQDQVNSTDGSDLALGAADASTPDDW